MTNTDEWNSKKTRRLSMYWIFEIALQLENKKKIYKKPLFKAKKKSLQKWKTEVYVSISYFIHRKVFHYLSKKKAMSFVFKWN